MATVPKIRDFKMAVFKIQDSETLTIPNSPELEILRLMLKKSRDFETWPKIAETQANFGDHFVWGAEPVNIPYIFL